jgi:Ni,Fe-hydrogenase I cytochrome b subunit
VCVEHLGPVVDSVVKISDTLEKITKLQHYLRVREQAHRDTQESTNSRVSWFTIAEAIVLISISGFQIYYIQNLFGDAKLRRRV